MPTLWELSAVWEKAPCGSVEDEVEKDTPLKKQLPSGSRGVMTLDTWLQTADSWATVDVSLKHL